MKNTLVVGDIQGCLSELLDLIEKAGLSADNEIVALGDVVDRGPQSPGVVEFLREKANARSIMGNHERKHIRSHTGELRASHSQVITRFQFGEERYSDAVDFMARFPTFLELPEVILAHAYCEPGIPLAEQRDEVLLGTMSGEKHLRHHYRQPWYELYDQTKPIIVGHHDYLRNGEPFVYRDRVFGIDTGCCYGARLTGLLLPEFRFVSIPSRANHWFETKRWYEEQQSVSKPLATLSWEKIEAFLARSSLPTGRAAELRELVEKGERALGLIHEFAHRQSAQILSDLADAFDFAVLSESDQAREFASRVAGPWAKLLHRARRSQLSMQDLRRLVSRPAEALTLAERLSTGLRASPDALGTVEHRVRQPKPTVLALDLEGTLILDAVTVFVRPGLKEFLDFCRDAFERVVLFTCVSEERVRWIANVLASEGTAPGWFAESLECVAWDNRREPHKDLRFVQGVPPEQVLLVDDQERFVHPDQAAQWVPIQPYENDDATDRELMRVQEVLRARIGIL